MGNWKFNHHEVLEDQDGYWWHVVNRFECRDTGERLYRLYDGTHTGDRYEHAEHVEGANYRDGPPYESAGWSTTTKPAHEHGYRVNGVLCEPASVERFLGCECVSECDCPECGEPTTGEADIIVDLVNRQRSSIKIICGACGVTRQWDPDA